ncbi:A/G-specific adenine glycosylase [Rarobacter faecitabidus]|nr:A/G-specific adenine glycosylase [Rarobacter faecitabidus]
MPAIDPTLLHRELDDWFAREGRDLPWRRPDCSPWGVLVSEIMLQQTPVARVLPRWIDWLIRWPTPADLANAPTDEVLRAWDRLGYPRRALRLAECARAIVDQHGGMVPRDEDALRSLPGIGEYTAAAVVAFAFGGRSTVLDTNVRRVLARGVGGEALPRPHLTTAERQRAGALVPEDPAAAARWAAATMELGALVCTARNPACDRCPIAGQCAWLAAGKPADAHAVVRRTQAWHGTDRQVRGQIMRELRAADRVGRSRLLSATTAGSAQFDRALESLVHDGLAVEWASPDDEPQYSLPAARTR